MRLLIDAGNTRLKWQLSQQGRLIGQGSCLFDRPEWLQELAPYAGTIQHVAVSTVVSEARRYHLADQLKQLSGAEAKFYWAEASRGCLRNAYSDFSTMGADRWHAMYAAWHRQQDGFAVIDAGSAITVDYVGGDGAHLGGYILAGKHMMLRALQQDAARIGFEPIDAQAAEPGASTTECVQHGLIWLWKGLVQRLSDDCLRHGLGRIVCTGGDAPVLLSAGLAAEHDPDLVLAGLAAIDAEDAGL